MYKWLKNVYNWHFEILRLSFGVYFVSFFSNNVTNIVSKLSLIKFTPIILKLVPLTQIT